MDQQSLKRKTRSVERTGNLNERRLKLVINAIQRQPQLRPHQLAEIVRLSPSHLQRLFRTTQKVGMAAYSKEVRLQRARQLLRTSYRSIKEIREEAGFTDASNFSRYFKRRFGASPTAYRNAMRVFTNK